MALPALRVAMPAPVITLASATTARFSRTVGRPLGLVVFVKMTITATMTDEPGGDTIEASPARPNTAQVAHPTEAGVVHLPAYETTVRTTRRRTGRTHHQLVAKRAGAKLVSRPPREVDRKLGPSLRCGRAVKGGHPFAGETEQQMKFRRALYVLSAAAVAGSLLLNSVTGSTASVLPPSESRGKAALYEAYSDVELIGGLLFGIGEVGNKFGDFFPAEVRSLEGPGLTAIGVAIERAASAHPDAVLALRTSIGARQPSMIEQALSGMAQIFHEEFPTVSEQESGRVWYSVDHVVAQNHVVIVDHVVAGLAYFFGEMPGGSGTLKSHEFAVAVAQRL